MSLAITLFVELPFCLVDFNILSFHDKRTRSAILSIAFCHTSLVSLRVPILGPGYLGSYKVASLIGFGEGKTSAKYWFLVTIVLQCLACSLVMEGSLGSYVTANTGLFFSSFHWYFFKGCFSWYSHCLC